MLQAALPCSCLWQWEVAESRPSAAALWQPGSFVVLSTALKCRDCGFLVEHVGPWVRMWHLVLFLQQVRL